MDVQWVGEAAEAQRSGSQPEHRRAARGRRTAWLQSGSGVSARESQGARQARRLFRAQARAIPSGSADRVEHALPSVRSYETPALDDGPLSLALGRLSGVRRETQEEEQWPTTHPAAPFLRGGGTGLLTVPGWEPLRRRVVAGAGREKRPEVRKPRATARAQDAVGADCDAPPWPHRLEEAVEEGVGGQRQPFPRRGAS